MIWLAGMDMADIQPIVLVRLWIISTLQYHKWLKRLPFLEVQEKKMHHYLTQCLDFF